MAHSALVAAPVPVVSKRLGHACAKMTLEVYANYLPDQHEDALS